MIITRNSRGKVEVTDKEDRMSALLKHLEQRAKVRGPTELSSHINNSLPSGTKISKESVRRWLKGEQVPSEEKKRVFARAIACPVDLLDEYLDGKTSAEEFFSALDSFKTEVPDEALLYQEIRDKAENLSLPWLGQLISVLGEKFSVRWAKSGLVPDHPVVQSTPKIREVVCEHWQSCMELFEEGATLKRLQAIRDGDKPSEEELDLIQSASGLDAEDLNKIVKEEFNGCEECRNNP